MLLRGAARTASPRLGPCAGEDTVSGHQNDYVWWYDFATSSLTRIMSMPYGAETTSPYYYPDLNGFSYIVAVVQHPYDESDEEKLLEPANTGVECHVGYLGAFEPHTCADRWAQCGGEDWTGPTCCTGTDVCYEVRVGLVRAWPACLSTEDVLTLRARRPTSTTACAARRSPGLAPSRVGESAAARTSAARPLASRPTPVWTSTPGTRSASLRTAPASDHCARLCFASQPPSCDDSVSLLRRTL